MADVTQILNRLERGDAAAAEQLLPLVYDELRRLAAARMAKEKPGQTLQPTALVHEAWLRLIPNPHDVASPGRNAGEAPQWNGRGHFFAAAAEAMRRILVENARRKQRIKHGGGQERADVDVAEIATTVPDDDLLALDEALSQLKAEDPVKAKLIELRFFVGLSNEQAAEVLGISSATAKRHWRYARAWLHRTIEADSAASE